MNAYSIPAILVICALTAVGAEKTPKPPKVPPTPKAHANTGPGGGPPAPKRATDEQVEKLAKMSAMQRETALSNLPPARRARVEAGLDKWNRLSPEQKAQQEKFQNLPPETQVRIRQLSDKIKALPNDRKVAVRQEIARLRNMPDAKREQRLNSLDLKKDFTPEEREILRESPSLLPHYYF